MLIECVRKSTILYDVKAIAYRNVDKKEAAWRKIAEELDYPG